MGQGRAKRLAAVLAAAGSMCVGLVTGAVPAFAAPITTQPYLDTVGITQLHAQGLDGTGVKIALIDGPVDTSVPELQGVTVVKKAFCDVDYVPSSVAHATEIASILASPGYGWAPKATILNYATPVNADAPAGEIWSSAWPDCTQNGQSQTIGYQVEQALNDGADVISISLGNSIPDSSMTFPLARAALKGVPVLMSAGNDATPSIDVTANANTVVAVGAIDQSGQRASYSSWGPGLSVMAYGGPVTGRKADSSGGLTLISTTTWGTSYAAPMVAGALALAKQKWPDANGNQLVRVMFDTIDGVADHQSNQTLDMGFGVLNAPAMVATDPAGYSSDNVLAQKNPDGHPTPDEFAAYRDGTADPYTFGADNDYVYRGCDPMILEYSIPPGMKVEASTAPGCQASPSPTPPATQTPTTTVTPTGTGVPWVVIGAGAVIVALIIVVGVVLLRRPAGKHRPPGPPVPPPTAPPGGWQQPTWQQPAPSAPQAVPQPAPWPAAPYPVPPQPPQYPSVPPSGL